MKKIVSLVLALVLCTALAIPAMAQVIGGKYENGVYTQGFYFDGETIPSGQHNGVNIEKNSSVKIDGAVKITGSSLRIYENGTLTITENGSLSGRDIVFYCEANSKIVLKNGAWIRLEFDTQGIANDFETLLQASGITYTRNGDFITAGKVPPCEHNNLKTVCVDCGEVISTYSATTAVGSALSEGNLTIICTIAAAVVFGLGGFFLGTKKKKKTALAGGVETDEE